MNKHPAPGSSQDPETSHEEEVREPPSSDGKVTHEEFPRKGDIVDPSPSVGDK